MTETITSDAPENPRIFIGANNPPLGEQLTEMSEALRKRQAELIKAVPDCPPVTDETSEKTATTFAGMLATCGKALDKMRAEVKESPWEACKTIDTFFKDLMEPIVGRDFPKTRGGHLAAVMIRLDNFSAEQARITRVAAAAAAKAEQDARDAAEKARKEAEELAAKADPASQLEAEDLAEAARHHETVADQHADHAFAPVARAVVRGAMGASTHKVEDFVATITDWPAAMAHALTLDEQSIHEIVQKIYDRQVRAKVRVLPGATVEPVSKTRLRT